MCAGRKCLPFALYYGRRTYYTAVLARVIYSCVRRLVGQYELPSADDWAAVLRLATLWGIDSVRSLAITQLTTKATFLHKLVLARAHNIPDWVEPSVDALARRAEPLSLEEANLLGMEDVLRVSAVREKVRATQHTAAPAVSAPRPTSSQAPARQPAVNVARPVQAPVKVKVPLPEVTVPFTRKELEELSTLLSRGEDFEKVFDIVTMDKIPAFGHAATDFSSLLAPYNMHISLFSSDLFNYIATRPAYIPVAVKLASFIALHHDSTESSLRPVLRHRSSLRYCLQEDVDRLRDLWGRVRQARAKYPDFNLAYKSGSRSSPAAGLLGLEMSADPPRESVYNERSANAGRFIAALSAESVRLVK